MVIFCLARIDLGDFKWLSGFMMFLSLVQSTVGAGWPALGVFLGQHRYDSGLMDDEKNVTSQFPFLSPKTWEKWMKVMMCHDVLISVEKWILLWVVISCEISSVYDSWLLYSIPCLFIHWLSADAGLHSWCVAVDLFQVSVLSRGSRAKLPSCQVPGLAFTTVTCTKYVANPLATGG